MKRTNVKSFYTDTELKNHKAAIRFVRGEIREEEYTKRHINTAKNIKKDGDHSRGIMWSEAPLLKVQLDLYIQYLTKLSLGNRRKALCGTVGTQEDISSLCGIQRQTIGRFYNSKSYDDKIEILVKLAILFRVPVTWIYNEKIETHWDTAHFHLLRDAVLTPTNFLDLLMNANSEDHIVKGVILKFDATTTLYLRVELVNGGFLIELFNKNASLYEVEILKRLLKNFKLQIGIMHTVISMQKNFVFISKSLSEYPICLPKEFESLS